jgi:hypothetical protein
MGSQNQGKQGKRQTTEFVRSHWFSKGSNSPSPMNIALKGLFCFARAHREASAQSRKTRGNFHNETD